LFTEAIWAVKVLANDLETDPKFRSMGRLEHLKVKFYDRAHDWPIIIIEKNLETEIFNMLLDTTLTSVKETFEQFL
jgi:hypothetical protein